MINNELYNNIIKAKLNDSIILASNILLCDDDKNIDIIENTFIAVCSYIGSFVSIYDIKLWLNIIENLNYIIKDSKIRITDVYVLIGKMCLLCDIYIKNPVIKTGTISLKILRENIIDLFININFKLTMEGLSKFEGIIPPIDSPSYMLSQQIITGIVYIFKQINNLSYDDKDKIFDFSNKIRNSFDYIIRKKYTFETKFYESDNDAVWFLWGIVTSFCNNNELENIYYLFCYLYNKKTRPHRIGLLWGTSITMVYINKKDIARNWNSSELKAIEKLREVSIELFNDIKKTSEINNSVNNEKKNTNIVNGIDFILNYKPNINNF